VGGTESGREPLSSCIHFHYALENYNLILVGVIIGPAVKYPTAMPPRWQFAILTSLAVAYAIVQKCPKLAVLSSFSLIFTTLLLVQWFALAIWKVTLYPKLFSPFRHLPHPTVNAPIPIGYTLLKATGRFVPPWPVLPDMERASGYANARVDQRDS
jgi:hypothetical protein